MWRRKYAYKSRKCRAPNKMNQKGPIPRVMIIKMLKVKDEDKILKAAREKQLLTYNRAPVTLSVNFSTETLRVRSKWTKYSDLS